MPRAQYSNPGSAPGMQFKPADQIREVIRTKMLQARDGTVESPLTQLKASMQQKMMMYSRQWYGIHRLFLLLSVPLLCRNTRLNLTKYCSWNHLLYKTHRRGVSERRWAYYVYPIRENDEANCNEYFIYNCHGCDSISGDVSDPFTFETLSAPGNGWRFITIHVYLLYVLFYVQGTGMFVSILCSCMQINKTNTCTNIYQISFTSTGWLVSAMSIPLSSLATDT